MVREVIRMVGEVRGLSETEWWVLARHVEGVPGSGPMTGLPLGSVIPTRSELKVLRDRAAFWLMGHAGLRVGELVRLPWEAVWRDVECRRAMELGHGVAKGNRTRVVPIDGFVRAGVERLWRALAAHGGPPVGSCVLGVGPEWRRCGVRGVQKRVAGWGRVALGRSVGCHALRHTFAVRLRRRTDVAVVQRLLGHARLSSTQVYAGVTADECEAAVGALSA